MSTSLELINLEQLLEEDCKCEVRDHGTIACSVEATHFSSAKCEPGKDLVVCLNAAVFCRSAMSRQDLCATCLGLASECWTIRPI